MNLSTVRAPKKASENRKTGRPRMGFRMGKTSARATKASVRAGGSRMLRGFEGGQMPLHRRLPKRGFTNIFRVEYVVVNLERLLELWSVKYPEVLKQAHITKRKSDRIKVLGEGELQTALTIQAHKFSKSAQEKITSAGGKFEVLA